MALLLPLLLSGCLGLTKFSPDSGDTATNNSGLDSDGGDGGGIGDGGGDAGDGGGDAGDGGDGGDGGGDAGDGGGDSGSGDGGDGGDDTEEPEPTPGLLEISSSLINFGTVDVGDWAMETLTLTNTGEDALSLESIDFSDSAFDWGGEIVLPYTFSGGASRDITVTFNPDAGGILSGTAELKWSGESDQTTPVTLQGEGNDPCAVCAPIIDVNTGGSDPYSMPEFYSTCGLIDYVDSQSVTISNVGDEPLMVSGVTVKNDIIFVGGTFTVRGFSATTLSPGASTSFTVEYEVTESGADVDYWATFGIDSNTVHITSNDASEPDYVIGLTGVAFCI